MSEPIILADDNLIRNGEFSERLDHWTKGPVNSKNIQLLAAWYPDGGFEIRFLHASDGASVYQEFTAPKTLGPDAHYNLGFLYETYGSAAGRLLIEVLREGVEPFEQSLEPTHTRVTDEEGGQPLDFEPREIDVPLTAMIEEGDLIRISLISPLDPILGIRSKIHVARLRLRLHLPPLQLQQIKLDNSLYPADRPLYLCYGASGGTQHHLEFLPDPGHPWSGTSASLTSEDNPQGAIISTPDWGKDQRLDSDWQLDCPALDVQTPQSLSLILHSQYTAEPYPIEVSLGHHRLAFRERLEAAYDPVLEYAEEVRLGVQVVSHYTGSTMRGQAVTWKLDGMPYGDEVLTDGDGWAFLLYQPTTEGRHVLLASVESLYHADGVFTQELIVQVLKADPWRDVLEVVEGSDVPWAGKTGYPNRGSTYALKLKLLPDSPLLGSQISLQWDGDVDAPELGVEVQPPLEEPVEVTKPELGWQLTCDDLLDGQFKLSLVCSRLLRHSPEKSMVLARNLVQIGELREANKSPVVDEQESVLVRIQVLHLNASGAGDPVVNALVDWDSPHGAGRTYTGAGGWASWLDTPTTDGVYEITAKVRAHEEMAPIEHPFKVTALPTSPWKDEVTFSLDGDPIDLTVVGVICRRGRTHRFKVTPVPGSVVWGRPMTLTFRNPDAALGLKIGDPISMDGGWEWPISSEVDGSRSGLFELLLTSEALKENPRDLSGRLLSLNPADEVRVVLDQQQVNMGGDSLYPCLGARHRFSLQPDALSPLVGLTARLMWSGDSAEKLQARVDPPGDQTQALSDGGASWWLDFTDSPLGGEFALGLELPQLAFQSPATDMVLGHNKLRIGTLSSAVIDPVVGEDDHWMWLQVFSAYTRQPAVGVPVIWTAEGRSLSAPTDAEGWSGFEFVPASVEEHEVIARVLSPYDGSESSKSIYLKALASNPWEGLMMAFDGQPAKPWEETCFPRRGGQHSFNVTAPPGSLLFGRELTLGMSGTGPAELGITFTFALLGQPRYFSESGLDYHFNVGNLRDGGFALRFAASNLARLSPANAMSVGPGSQVVSFLLGSRAERTLDWGQTLDEHVTVVSSISGRALRGITVKWKHPELGEVSSVTNYHGVARISFKPRTPGRSVLTATAGDELHSESVELVFTLNEPREIAELYEPADSRLPPDESRAHACARVVSALTGLPLALVEVWWGVAGLVLTPSLTNAEGVADLTFTLPAAGDGVLSASVKGGFGGWEFVQMSYGGVVPVIESLTCDRTQSYTGHTVRAEARVVDRRDGRPLPRIRFNWEFAGKPLSDSVSDNNGWATMTFVTPVVGEFDLVASLASGPPATKTQRITVEQLPTVLLRSIYAVPAVIRIGTPSDIRVQVFKGVTTPVEGILVRWMVNDNESSQSFSNEEGWARFRYIGTVVGEFNIAAAVDNPLGTVKMSLKVKVINS